MDPRLLPKVEVFFDESALKAIGRALNVSGADWLKRTRIDTEKFFDVEPGARVAMPGLPDAFRLLVTGKVIRVPRESDPFIELTFSADAATRLSQ